MLHQETATCLAQALTLAKEFVSDGSDTVAVSVVGSEPSDLLIGHDYWSDHHGVTFEHKVAHNALERRQKYGAFVVPLLYRGTDEGSEFRDPRLRPNEGETHMLFALTWHIHEGYDIHRVLYTRRPNGDPVFETLQSLGGSITLPATSPGAALVRSAIQHHGGSHA